MIAIRIDRLLKSTRTVFFPNLKNRSCDDQPEPIKCRFHIFETVVCELCFAWQVGEVMAFGRTFQESFQKAFRGLEVGLDGWCMGEREYTPVKDQEELMYNLRVPNPERMQWVYKAFRQGMTEKQINEITNIDPWCGPHS